MPSTPLLLPNNDTTMPPLQLTTLRKQTLILALMNSSVSTLGIASLLLLLHNCSLPHKLPVIACVITSCIKLASMIAAGIAQGLTAKSICEDVDDDDFRRIRRVRYRRWLWWTRFGMVVTVVQFMVALYLMYIIVNDISYNGGSGACFLGQDAGKRGWKQILMVSFLVLLWVVVIIQCFTGSDVLRWRSFYATHDTAWKAHYREVFDHGIREALCCMGRVKYMSVLEEDEVYSVARLLGDLVAYRASGTGHLELLAGLALLQKHKQSPKPYSEIIEASDARIQEAAMFHKFAEAAYTGPLLDFGRNPVLFPCAWFYRQGVLTPWARNRRPKLEGDNWWRGHAAAFLKFVKLSPETLRQGRVKQAKREAAYFIVVLHELKSIVIAVRGTETPEDLLTDGLCRECSLSVDDLDGLINNDHLPLCVRETVLSTFPHYGHSGIVESARELFMQIDGHHGQKDDLQSERSGFLSSLLGEGRECHGYKICVVGHSLGGAVATLLGIRLSGRYPNLHVYAYGSLPCVDSVIAEACSDFVTSIVYNDEFSARLSVNSIMRLRAAAISALSDDSSAQSVMIRKFTRRILNVRKHRENKESQRSPTPATQPSPKDGDEGNHVYERVPLEYSIKGGVFLCGQAVPCMTIIPRHPESPHVIDGITSEPGGVSKNVVFSINPDQELHGGKSPLFNDLDSDNIKGLSMNEYSNSYFVKDGIYECSGNSEPALPASSDDSLSVRCQESPFVDNPPSTIEVSIGDFPEVFLPGLIIHIIPEERSSSPLWKNWVFDVKGGGYKAFMANRENFTDIVVSPYMFLDHLPWRCHRALKKLLESQKSQGDESPDSLNGEHFV